MSLVGGCVDKLKKHVTPTTYRKNPWSSTHQLTRCMYDSKHDLGGHFEHTL